MIYCPSCGTGNRDGSRFCNECGTKLPTMTSSLCPTCGTPNPPHSLFCEKCGARLIASLAEEPQEPETSAPSTFVPKGLSLPIKSPAEAEPAAQSPVEPQKPPELAQPAEEELPDWMQVVRSAVADSSESDIATTTAASSTSDRASTDEVPDWLSDLRLEEESAQPKKPQTGELLPEWAQRLRTMPEATQPSAAEEEVPDWLKALGTTGQLPFAEETPVEGTPLVAAGIVASPEPAAAEEEELPEWLKEPPSPDFSTVPSETPPPPPATQAPVTQAQPAAEEMPDWLRDLRPAAGAEEALPDWLDELGGEEQPAAESMALSTGDSALDWLSQLGASAPERPSDQGLAPAEAAEAPDWMSSLRATSIEAEAAAEEEGVPDWLRGAGLAAAGAAAVSAFEEEQPPEPATPQKPVTDWLAALRQATPEMEAGQAAAEEVPEWMREESGVAPGAIGEAQAYEQEVPEWLREAGATYETTEEQPAAQAAEEGIPEWLRGAGLAAGAAAVGAFEEEQPPEPAAPQKLATDWLSALRQATPEIEAEQPSEEAEPEWLREESGVAPGAIGGVQSYDQEVPDWLREEPGATFETAQPPVTPQAEEEGVPDWLKGLGGAAVGAAAVAAAPRAEEPSDEGLPDWLRAETAPPAQPEVGEVPEWLREAEPTPALKFETPPAEEVAPGETPDWLRELAPTAAVTRATRAAAEPEVEELEEPIEAEAEAESWVSKAAPVAVAGLAAAAAVGAAKKPEQAEAAPAEMPEWLKEIRREQQIAKTAIPVPPPEAAGLTQAEIPAWLEALRPREEAAAPQEAETPSETEGPLAGIANALPPAPIMGEMRGLPAKLQFAVSAEDQARAGVLKELLGQHAVAPAAVEQFVVKGSAIRRRALRWLVAFLLIAGIFLTKGTDINQAVKPLQLVPKVQEMVPPQYISNAAFQIFEMAQQPPGSKVLVVFDYDATQAGELNRVATALLRSPALGNTQIEVASLNPQGSVVAQMVKQQVAKDVPGFEYKKDLGFKPGQVNGIQALLAEAGDVKLIITLAASPETVRWWAEQMKANGVKIPLVAGISAGAEPLTMPYLQSGQVKGLVSGLPGEMMYLNATGVMGAMSKSDPQRVLDDYQAPLDGLALANYIMVVLIIVGLIGALLRGSGRRSA